MYDHMDGKSYYFPTHETHLEEEVGTCRCSDCKEGAALLRVTEIATGTEELLSNCCYAAPMENQVYFD